MRKAAERVGFVPSHAARSGRTMPESSVDANDERSEEMVERVGFVPSYDTHSVSCDA